MSELRTVGLQRRKDGLGPPEWAEKHVRCDYWIKLFWATPPWISQEHLQQMREIYRRAGSHSHVDHIVPLKGPGVCGLHVPWNLQVLPPAVNLAKLNHWWPDSPNETEDIFGYDQDPHQLGLPL